MPQAENETQNDDALRRFIDRLEAWPDDEPPSPAELRALRREIRLTQDDREKLEILADNHVRRARSAAAGGAYDQAAAELSRAAQLRPLDPRPRVELADLYLQRSLERGYGRNDRQKALRLARKALDLNPSDPDAKAFLRDYRRMNAAFVGARYRRYRLPILVAFLALSALAWWQRDWVIDLTRPSTAAIPDAPASLPPDDPGGPRDVPVEAPGLAEGGLTADIVTASVGSRRDASYLEILGRLESENAYIGELTLLVRGRDAGGAAVFALPWIVRDENAPLLIPGDSEVLTLFRWLDISETAVERIELSRWDADVRTGYDGPTPRPAELVWDSGRPDGGDLETEVRRLEVVEAYDRQVALVDLAVQNTGTAELTTLDLDLSLDSREPPFAHRAVHPREPPLAPGERRVWSLAMSFPLDADLADRPLTVRVRDARR